MHFFVIDRLRLEHHINKDVKNARGQLNWSYSVEGQLLIYLSCEGVNYIFEEEFDSFDDIPKTSWGLSPINRIYGQFETSIQLQPPTEIENHSDRNPIEQELKKDMLKDIYGVK